MSGSTSGLLAAWATAFLQQQISVDDVIEHVLGHKSSAVQQAARPSPTAPWHEPTTPLRLVPEGSTVPLVDLLVGLRTAGVDRLHATFPIPGDAGGVGPGPALAPAYDAGEAVIVDGLPAVLVVAHEDDDTIEVVAYPSPARIHYISVGEAALELTEAIHRSTSILTDLDVASWDPRIGRISRRALDEVHAGLLPDACPSRASHLLVRAHQLRSILVAAAGDPGGGSVNSHEAAARDAALAPLNRHIARALAAAYNSVPYP